MSSANFILFLYILILRPKLFYTDDGINATSEEPIPMDIVPTGYLPDSVYKELAWYGISQLLPLPYSSKNKLISTLIWKNTINRPHVILESPPQPLRSNIKVSRRILAEEAAKWSREQRSKQEVLIETIKTGGNGNGLTIRAVISATNNTKYIISNGVYYKCPSTYEPDAEYYQTQGNYHDKRCTFNRTAEPVEGNIDPCIEAETTVVEYSVGEEWVFCFGNEEREVFRFINNTIDCGKKTKMLFNEVMKLCAIDNNIIITYDYFGEEPRKDILKNITVCYDGWNPCHLTYFYRLEPPTDEEIPVFPTTTPNPCETTPCPWCIEGNEAAAEGLLVHT